MALRYTTLDTITRLKGDEWQEAGRSKNNNNG